MKRLVLALAAVALLAGCAANPNVVPPEQLATLAYKNTGPVNLKLYTVINRRSGSGGHTALGVNASERVLFDPAGKFEAEGYVRSGDVIYSFDPKVEKSFTSAHARSTYLVREQTIPVTPEVAEQALRLVKANGAVSNAMCAQSTSQILSRLPGFQTIRPTMFPRALEAQLVSHPGVKTVTHIEDD
ncbi:hypothetical protein [Pseudooceanicola sp.]|jgi:hypothetical protein|uniref:hypothetical protein n=1 Tax=Pseudooceanicola sp. TaxID=1914328 RepID=UPI000C09E915|nr:hypothetical protein [Pseudooceanicola sp.]